MKEKLIRFFAGRYGIDQFNKFLCVLAFVLFILSSLTRVRALYALGLVAWFYEIFRMLSRNIYKRNAENMAYLHFSGICKHHLLCIKNNIKDREHKYYVCPKCSKMVRVPKGKGRISIACPACGQRFDGKS